MPVEGGADSRWGAERARTIAGCVLVFILALYSIVDAQTATITGHVTDRQSVPLAGANVFVKGTVLGVATDDKGAFVLRKVPAGEHVLVVSMLGYERTQISVVLKENDTRQIDVRMTETSLQTSEVVVTAGRRPQSLEEVPSSMSIVDAGAIEERTYISLDQALRNVPGVNMTESQVNIRGSSGYSRAFGTRVLILVDGVPQLSGDAGEIKYDAVPMFTIDRIEVVKGAGSALYGSSALGGVINVITREPDGPVNRVRLSTGMYDSPHYAEWKWSDDARLLGSVDLQHGNKTGRFTYLLTGGLRRNEGYRKNDDFTRWNFNGKAHYRPTAETELGAFVNYAYDHRGNWIYWSGLDSALVPPFNSDPTEKIISTKFQSGLSLRGTVSPQFSYLTRVHLYRTMFDTESDTANYDLHPADRTQSTAYAFGAEAQGTWSVHSTDVLVFGVEGTAGLVDSKTFGDKDAVSLALYAQNEWIVTDDVVFSAGVRFDWTRVDTIDAENRITPRAGITYSPFKGTTLRSSIGTGFRSPSIAERYVSASAGPLSTKPNPNLKSETSISYEVGFKQELPLPAVLDAAVFWTDYDNLVEPTLDATDKRIMFANITEARITGYEIGLLGTVLNGLFEYSLGYTYMYPRDPRTNTPLKYRPRHLLYASSRVQYRGISLGVDYRFISRVEAIDAAAAQFIPNADSRVETHVMDARLGYDFSKIGVPLTAVFAVNNVFNYNYTEIMANIAPIRQFMLTVEWTM